MPEPAALVEICLAIGPHVRRSAHEAVACGRSNGINDSKLRQAKRVRVARPAECKQAHNAPAFQSEVLCVVWLVLGYPSRNTVSVSLSSSLRCGANTLEIRQGVRVLTPGHTPHGDAEKSLERHSPQGAQPKVLWQRPGGAKAHVDASVQLLQQGSVP